MRRSFLFSFVLVAACGGAVPSNTDAVNRSADLRAERQAFLLTADAHAVLAAAAKAYSQDSIDTCVSAWLDDANDPPRPGVLISKPDVGGFRAFLSACLGGRIPLDARSSGAGDMRTVYPQDLRSSGAGDTRTVYPQDLRSSGGGAVRSTSTW